MLYGRKEEDGPDLGGEPITIQEAAVRRGRGGGGQEREGEGKREVEREGKEKLDVFCSETEGTLLGPG